MNKSATLFFFVGQDGFEPSAFWSLTRRASLCATARILTCFRSIPQLPTNTTQFPVPFGTSLHRAALYGGLSINNSFLTNFT